MSTEYEELRAKIVKHCPELMELSFGCRVEAEQNGYEYTYLGKCLDEHWYLSDVNKACNDMRNNAKEGGLIKGKILGHPITLEHVLKALVSHVSTMKNSMDGVEAYGYVAELFANWELTKPLSSQSPETIKWLNSIIV